MTFEDYCAECGNEILGPPVTDENERWWLAGRGQVSVWCSTGCQDEYAERAWMRAIESDLENGVPDWKEEATAAQRLK